MQLTTRMHIRWLAVCALICVATSTAQAATIIKLNLADVGPDVSMNGAGILSTFNDGIAATTGDQNTSVEYTGFLNFIPDLNLDNASYTMSGLAPNGAANVNGTLVTQNYVGGQFSLFDPANVLLLSGNLTNSALAGVIGPPGTGALFTTTFGNVTGGTLAGLIVPGSISVSMNMTNVNGGNGFSVIANVLQPFLADASVNISGNPVPEPATLVLVALGSAAAAGFVRRRR
jgi:hypothetical protein